MSLPKQHNLSKLIRLTWASPTLCLALSGGFVADAVAQDVASGAAWRNLEEIVVSARRREESLQDVPIAVISMSEDYLRTSNIMEMTDLRTHVPSLSFSVGGNSTNVPQVALRGLRPMESLITFDSAVAMYFADVVMTPTHGTNLAMYDLASVQVLKGPQGTLFGRNSTGGAITMQPNIPGDTFGGYLETRLGNYDLKSFEGAVDLPVSDRVQFRVAGRAVKRDGYQSNVADNELAGKNKYWDEDSLSGRISMNVHLTDNLSNLLIVGYDENEMLTRVPKAIAFNPLVSLGGLVNSIWNGGLGIGGPSIDEAIARMASRSVHDVETDMHAIEEVENTVVSNTTAWELSDNLTVKNIFGYRKVDYAGRSDTDGTPFPIFGSIADPGSRVTYNPPPRVIDSEQFSNEFQLIGTALDDRLNWLAGYYYYGMKASESSPASIIGANPDWPEGPAPSPQLAAIWNFAQNGFLTNSPDGSVRNKSHAVFAEATYAVTEDLNLTLGARQTWDKREVTVRNGRSGACIVRDRDGNLLPNDACARTESESFSSPTWRLVADYQLTDKAMVYGSVSTGYRSGGFNLRGTDNPTLVPYDEENVLSYEIGSKSDWQFESGASLRTNVALYLSRYKDIQKTQDFLLDGAPVTNTVNAAKAEVRGVEFEAFLNPFENVELMVSYSYVDAQYKEWTKLINRVPVDMSNAAFVWIPKNSVNAYVKYHLPLDASLGDIALMASVYWQGDMVSDDDLAINMQNYPEPIRSNFLANEIIDGYKVINLRADWRSVLGSNFDLGIWINNLRDEEYTVGGLTVEDSQGWVSRVYGAPRTFGATVRWSF